MALRTQRRLSGVSYLAAKRLAHQMQTWRQLSGSGTAGSPDAEVMGDVVLPGRLERGGQASVCTQLCYFKHFATSSRWCVTTYY